MLVYPIAPLKPLTFIGGKISLRKVDISHRCETIRVPPRRSQLLLFRACGLCTADEAYLDISCFSRSNSDFLSVELPTDTWPMIMDREHDVIIE